MQLVSADANGVAGVQLPAPAGLGLVVDQHPLGGKERFDLAAAVNDPGELQQLAEPDHLAPDRNLAGHLANLAPQNRHADLRYLARRQMEPWWEAMPSEPPTLEGLMAPFAKPKPRERSARHARESCAGPT